MGLYIQFSSFTCKVKLASTLPAWFWDTHIKGPESSARAFVKMSEEVFSNEPDS